MALTRIIFLSGILKMKYKVYLKIYVLGFKITQVGSGVRETRVKIDEGRG